MIAKSSEPQVTESLLLENRSTSKDSSEIRDDRSVIRDDSSVSVAPREATRDDSSVSIAPCEATRDDSSVSVAVTEVVKVCKIKRSSEPDMGDSPDTSTVAFK